MNISVVTGSLTDQSADTYVVQLAEGTRRLSGHVAEVDDAMRGTISAMLSAGQITGKSGEATVIPTPGRRPRADRVVVVGVGKRNEFNLDGMRARVGNAVRRLREMNAGTVAVSTQLPASLVDPTEAGQAMAEGMLLGLYRFDRHHTKESDRPEHELTDFTLVEPAARRANAIERGVEVGQAVAAGAALARDLENEPANLMTPTVMAQRAQQIATEGGLDCRIIERAEAQRLGMGSYLSVSNGSVQPPKFIVLTYRGSSGRSMLGLVGKGITFDSGGISLKPGAGMESMKADMSGAATVLGAMHAIAALQPNVNVMGITPCTENMPSGSATKPGDVVYAMDGQSIEVINTDAEGRLVLADGIAFAKSEGCNAVIDVATLTGAMNVALGSVRTGVFSNNDRLWGELERASEATGERLWRMPLDREYQQQIKSDVADLKNTGGRAAGSITAAKFLEAFAGETPWAHMDIAGTMSVDRDRGLLVKGMSGIPVRTLVQLVRNRSRS
jgi:leucyl aminopeptidase